MAGSYSLSDKYPEYTYIQRIQGKIDTTPLPAFPAPPFQIGPLIPRPASTITFNGPQVPGNLFLCSDAYIKLKLRFQKIRYREDNGEAFVSGASRVDRIPVKPGMVLANSMRSAEVRLNQHSILYDDLRYTQKNINVQSFGKTYINKRLSTSGGAFWDNQGQISFTGESENNNSSFTGVAGITEYSTNLGVDNGFSESCDAWNALTEPVLLGGDGTKDVFLTEQLAFGPFKPRGGEGFGNSPYQGMSDLIPYVNQVGLTLSLNNYTANICEPYFAHLVQPVPADFLRGIFLDDGVLSAELVLRWVRPRPELIIQIPKQLYIKSFQYQHIQFPLNDGNPIQSNTSVSYAFNNIHTRQIPTQMMIWATVDKDDTGSYMASPINTWATPVVPTFAVENNNQTSFETNCKLEETTIRTNTLGGTDIWSAQYNEEEQYMYTTKNCHPDFPWTNTKFPGFRLRQATIAYETRGYQFLVLDTDDLKQYNIAGDKTGKLIRDQVWNFSGSLQPRDGFMENTNYTLHTYSDVPGPATPLRESERKYNFHVLFMYNHFRINLDKDGVVSSDFLTKFY